jgi:hypothetical protein
MFDVNVKNSVIVYSIVLLLICTTTTSYVVLAFKETATSRQDGYNKGYNDAICDLKSCHGHGLNPSCPSGHTDTFCSGYAEGYATAQGSNNNNNNNLSPRDNGEQSNRGNLGPGGSANQGTNDQTTGGQSSSGQGSSPVIAGDTTWKEFGLFIGPIQKHTGVFHNENGVFIPWTTLCNSGQSYLLQSCNSLINPDGSLTNAGDKAVGCITNGAIITVIATKLNMPLSSISNLLSGLAGITGCSGIVNLHQAQASPEIQRLAEFAGQMGN